MADDSESRYVQLPSGSYMEWPAGVSAEDFKSKAIKAGMVEGEQNPSGATPGFKPYTPPKPQLQTNPNPPSMLDRVADLRSGIDTAAQSQPIKKPSDILQNLGAGAARLTLQPFAHPVQTASGLAQMGRAAVGDVGAQYDVGKGIVEPFVRNPGGEAVANVPAAALALAGGGPRGEMPPVVNPAETAAERLMQAILPPEGITPGNVKAVMKEAPAIREYAGRTGNPLKTIPEGRVAAGGVAEEGLKHYRENFLDPNKEAGVTLENGVSPELGNRATLAQIEKRISDINDMTRGALRSAKSGGAEMTALERQGLEREGQALRQKLYQGLAEKTGVTPDEIQSLREGYGGQYGVKNALESGHYARLGRAGAESQGGSLPTSKVGLLDQIIRRGPFSQEAIANRQFSKRIAAFDPAAPVRPVPNPPQPLPFQGAPVGQELAQRLGAVGTPENAGVFRPPPVSPRPMQGPMAKGAAPLEAERVARELQEEQAREYQARKAAKQGTRGNQ